MKRVAGRPRSRSRVTHPPARLLPRGIRVREEVGQDAARAAVEALRAVTPHVLTATQRSVDLPRISLEPRQNMQALPLRLGFLVVEGAETGRERGHVSHLFDLRPAPSTVHLVRLRGNLRWSQRVTPSAVLQSTTDEDRRTGERSRVESRQILSPPRRLEEGGAVEGEDLAAPWVDLSLSLSTGAGAPWRASRSRRKAAKSMPLMPPPPRETKKKNAQTAQSEERPMTAPSRRALPSTLHALLALLALAVLLTPAAAAAERAPHPLPAPNADMDMCILTGTVFMYILQIAALNSRATWVHNPSQSRIRLGSWHMKPFFCFHLEISGSVGHLSFCVGHLSILHSLPRRRLRFPLPILTE